MKPPRVGTIITSLYGAGGDENRLIEHLRARNPDRVDHRLCVVLAPDESVESGGGSLRRRLEATGPVPFELGEVPLRLRAPLPHLVAEARVALTTARVVGRLARWLVRERIEVVDARLSLGTALAVAAARLAGDLPVVATTYGPRYFDRRGLRVLGRAVYRAVDTMVSDARPRLDDVAAFAGRPLRSVVVPNGIETPVVERTAAEVRTVLGIPEGAPVVGQVARFVDFKGQDRLVDALPPLLRRVPETHLVLCGLVESRACFDALVHRARAAGVAERVHLCAWPGPIGDIWQIIDVHAHPTRYDSSPIAIAEAMAMGLPSVATDVGGVAELIDDERTGRVLPSDVSAGRLGEVIASLLTSPNRRAEMGTAARARYETRHAPRVMAAGMEDVYREVASRRAASMA